MATNIGPKIGIDGEKEYRNQINQIIQTAKTLDAEMKAVTSAFDAQGDSQEKLKAQAKSLTDQIENQQKRIDALQTMTDKAAKKYGEADTRTLKWKQAVADATTELNRMQSQLGKVNDELKENSQQTATSHLDSLTDSISKQETELGKLKAAYMEAVLATGKASTETQEAAARLQKLSGELKENKSNMGDLQQEANRLAGELDEVSSSTKGADDNFQTLKITAGNLASSTIENLSSKLSDLASQILDTSETTKEHRSMMLKMEGSAQAFGYSVDYATEQYQTFYKYLGDDQMAVNCITNLTGMKTSTETVSKAAEAAIAVWSAYGDSIPIEGLTESINESAQVAQVTGNLADALNWAGISEDEFNTKLSVCKDTQERANLIADTLNDTYGESKKHYDENAQSMLAVNDAQRELLDSQSEAADSADELNSELSTLKSEAFEAALPIIKDVTGAITDCAKWFNGLDDNAKSVITTAASVALGLGALGTTVSKVVSIVKVGKDAFHLLKSGISGVFDAASLASGGLSGLGTVAGEVVGVAGGVGLAIAGFVTLKGALEDAWEQTTIDHLTPLSNGFSAVQNSIENAESYLDDFNLTLFASSDKQQELADNMQTVQDRITTVCQTASEERRGYTSAEIQELKDLFQQMSDIAEQEYGIYTSRIQSMQQYAVENARQAGQVGINEYMQMMNDDTLSMQQAFQEQSDFIEQTKIDQLALLNETYTTEEQRQSQAYLDEKARIEQQAEEKLALAQQSVAAVSQSYLDGLNQYCDVQELYRTKVDTYNKSLEDVENTHAENLAKIRDDSSLDEQTKQALSEQENQRYKNELSTVWSELSKNLTDEQGKALGAYAQMAAETETYGGTITDETKNMVTGMISSMDVMPESTKSTMTDAMEAIGTQLTSYAPGLFAKAKDLASGIASIFESFWHHSTPDEGPLKHDDKWMPDMIDNLVGGLKGGIPAIEKATAEVSDALAPTLPDYSALVSEAAVNANRLDAQAQIYSDLHSGGITVNWDGYPQSSGDTNVEITVNAAEGQSAEEIANAVAWRLQHQIDQQRRGKL